MEETREETPQDLRNLALKVAGLLEEAGQHERHEYGGVEPVSYTHLTLPTIVRG